MFNYFSDYEINARRIDGYYHEAYKSSNIEEFAEESIKTLIDCLISQTANDTKNIAELGKNAVTKEDLRISSLLSVSDIMKLHLRFGWEFALPHYRKIKPVDANDNARYATQQSYYLHRSDSMKYAGLKLKADSYMQGVYEKYFNSKKPEIDTIKWMIFSSIYRGPRGGYDVLAEIFDELKKIKLPQNHRDLKDSHLNHPVFERFIKFEITF